MNNQLKSVIILAVTLFIGVVIGALGCRAYIKHHPKPVIHAGNQTVIKSGPGGLFRGPRVIIKTRFIEGLALNKEQWRQIEPVLDEQIMKFEEIVSAHRKKITGLIDTIDTQITPYLSSGQVDKFNQMKKRQGKPRSKDGKFPGKNGRHLKRPRDNM